jgi:hypothetical protein
MRGERCRKQKEDKLPLDFSDWKSNREELYSGSEW